MTRRDFPCQTNRYNRTRVGKCLHLKRVGSSQPSPLTLLLCLESSFCHNFIGTFIAKFEITIFCTARQLLSQAQYSINLYVYECLQFTAAHYRTTSLRG